MKSIALTKGFVTWVTDSDYEWLNKWKWLAKRDQSGNWYAARIVDKHYISMHRIILSAPSGVLVDHINGNTLDNRRENLRLCSPQENARNRSLNKNHPTGYKGVTVENNKYRARIRYNYALIELGFYSSPVEAAKAYDAAARRLYGKFARLNFPD